ncbi:MAG: GDSL-type esterase/lipase family protein [Clostridiaceae bacterium]
MKIREKRIKRRNKRRNKIIKRTVGLLAVFIIGVGMGIGAFNKGNNKKTSLVYASHEKSESNSSKENSNKESDNKDKDNETEVDKAKADESKDSKNNEVENAKDNTTNKAVNDSSKNNNTKTPAKTDTTRSNNSTNYKEFFKEDVFMGDSVTEGISYYEFVQEENVYAKKGSHINAIKNELNKIESENPRNIYLLYGLNDLGAISNQWFIDQYRELVRSLKAKFPNSNIYVQSILPVLPKAESSKTGVNNKKINEYNSMLIDMAKEENINFLNIGSLINDSNKNLYEPDGIHFKADFYKLMLNYIRDNVN